MASHPVNGQPPIRLLFAIGGAKVETVPPPLDTAGGEPPAGPHGCAKA